MYTTARFYGQEGPVFIDQFWQVRRLASLPSNGWFKANLPKFGASNPIIPKSNWYEINRRSVFDADWIFDQGQVGECVACGGAGALRRARFIAGNSDVKLSSGALYAQINGGRDQGAVISDGLQALMSQGTCSYATVGTEPFYLQQLPRGWQEEASRFKVAKAYHCESWEEVITAVLLGYIPFYGYMVGRNFEDFDQYGVAGHSSGPGNHCNCADGVVRLPDGRWVLDDVNSWSPHWGPFKNGRAYIDEQHLFGGGDQPDVCVIQVSSEDPQGPVPPVVKDA